MPKPVAGSSRGSKRGTLKTNNVVGTGGPLGRLELRCCASGCDNDEERYPGKVFYPFPADPSMRSQWLRKIRRPDLLELSPEDRVCSDHFKPSQYTSKGSLQADALPIVKSTKKRVADEGQAAGPSRVAPKRKPTEETETQNRGKRPRSITKSNTEVEIRVEIKEEPQETTNYEPETVTEDLTLDVKEEVTTESPVHIETQCIKDVKDEPGVRNAASQTFSRKELYLSVACYTTPEHIDLPQPTKIPRTTNKLSTQTTNPLLAYFTDPIKKAMKAEIKATNKLTKTLTNAAMDKTKFMQYCDIYLNEKIAHIVKTHSHIQEKFVGNRYGHEFKMFALNLCLSNPESYKFVEQIFNLPSRTTRRRLQLPARTGTNPNLIEYLKVKVGEMTEKEKVCAICFDVMRVAKNLWYEVNNDFLCGMQEIDQVLGPDPAEYAAVLIIRGLYTKWAQPISFSFMTEKRRYPELKEWLHKIIRMTFDIGLNVKVLVADLENDFMDVSSPNGEHYFEIDGKRIYYFYDVRYLFKSARDTLRKYDFHIGPKIVQWSHILNVYDREREHDLSLIPEITNAHVRPSKDVINDVNLAVQLFSSSVAAAMNYRVISKLIHQKVKDTVEFIAKMSKLMDILGGKSLRAAYRGTVQQNQVLSDVLEYFQALEVVDKRDNAVEAPFVTGLKANIRTAKSLLEQLQKEDLQYLYTKFLSMECVEAYFDEIRRLGGNCCERPTAIMFARSFRRLFLVNLVKKDGDNEQDLKSTLYKISEYMKSDTEKTQEPESERFKRMLGGGVGDIKIQWPSIKYVAGYLVWKCLEKHQCEIFIETLSVHCRVEANAGTLLDLFRKYNADNINNICLIEPPASLVDFVRHMDRRYCEYYTKPDRQPMNFGWNTYLFMENDTFDLPCECFPLMYMKLLFIRLKIEVSVREHNKLSKNPRKPRHLQKVVKKLCKKGKKTK